MSDGLHGCAIRIWRRNDFQQPHVARWIEKVRAEPIPAEILRKSFCNFRHRQPAGIGGDNGSRPAHRLHFAQQLALQLQVFDHRFDDPVGAGHELQVIFKVANSDQPRQPRLKKGRRFRFSRAFQPGRGNAVALIPIRPGICGNHVQQPAGNPGIGQVRGNPRPHGPRSQHRHAIDAFTHWAYLLAYRARSCAKALTLY